MTKDKWIERYAICFRQLTGWSQYLALKAGQNSWPETQNHQEFGDDPEGAAETDFEYMKD